MSPFSSSVSSARFAASESKLSSAWLGPPGQPAPLPSTVTASSSSRYSLLGERDRGLHVGRDLHGDVGAREPELHVQRETLADAEALGRHAEVRELPAAARRGVVPNDARIFDLDRADAEVEIARRRRAAVRGRRIRSPALPPPRSCQLLAPRALRARFSSRPSSRAWLISMRCDSSGNKRDAQLGAADARHRLVAESRRVAESAAPPTAMRIVGNSASSRSPSSVSCRPVASLHGGRDLVLVVVRVEQQADRNGNDDEQQNDGADDEPKNLEYAVHGITLVERALVRAKGSS